MNNIIQTEQILLRNECVYTHTSVCVTAIDENRGHEADREEGGYVEGCRRRKGKSEMICFHLKDKIRTKMQSISTCRYLYESKFECYFVNMCF